MRIPPINSKKITYATNIVSLGIQFFVAYQASILVPRQLGISAILLTVFSIFFKAAQFEGQFLYISKTISYKKLLKSSRASGFLLFLLQITSTIPLIAYSKNMALIFFSQGVISFYGFWLIDLYFGKNRVKEIESEEIKYQKMMTIQIIAFSIIPSLIILMFLGSFQLDSIIFKIYSFLLTLISFYLIINKIKIYFSINKILKNFPQSKYFLAPTIKRIDSSLLTLMIGFILGANILGQIQPIIKIGKATNILTPLYLKLNFSNLEASFKRQRIFILMILKYIFFSLLALTVSYSVLLTNLNLIQFSTVLLIFLFYATCNIKAFLWAYFFKIQKSDFAIKQHQFFLCLKILASIVLFTLLYFSYQIEINFIILAMAFPEFIVVLCTCYRLSFKKNN